ncbi:MAG: aldo/keto reductase [Bacteroidetes bacterium]|nr:aldo/keto reductase [Bacteroidota bacterium]
MNKRRFGRLGLNVSEIGHGMWGMGSWSDSNDEQSLDALQLSLDLGCNFFDTAWAYGEGRSEALLGKLVRANPGREIVTASKIPPRNRRWPSQRGFALEECFPPEYIKEYVGYSLKNAQLEYFDLMQFHVWEDAWAEDERWIRAIEDLKSDGLIRGVGISINRWEPWNGIRTVVSGHIDAVQVIYNIFDQDPEDELFPACREYDVAVIARVPFDEGTLTGKLTLESSWPKGDWRNTYFVPENLVPSIERAERLKEILPPDMTLAEMAMRFILNCPDVATVIPGMRALQHVTGNLGCSNLGPLPEGLHAELRNHKWDRTPTRWSH